VVAGVVSTAFIACPEGFYCPNGTGYDWKSCPAGSYGNMTGLASAEECMPCDGGKYCQGELVAPSGDDLDTGLRF
jgi:hypothetical protein